MKKIIFLMISLIISISIPVAAFAATPAPDTLQKGASGNQVIDVQQALRDLGFLNFRVTGKYSNITYDSVRRFQRFNQLPDDGQVGGTTLTLLLSGDAVSAPKNPKFKLVFGAYLQNPTSYGELTPWSQISTLLPVGGNVTIKDLYSNKTFQMQRTGGTGNARVETLNQADASIFVEMFGGQSTWEKRPVLAIIKGKAYAAALFGGPDGEDTIAGNGMQGGTQLYFLESVSDIFGIPDEEMRSAVSRAAGNAG